MQQDPDYSIKLVGDRLKDGKVYFKMQIYESNSKSTWNIQARFSQLRELHKALELKFPKGELPDFPPKGWWYQNQKPEFITKRKKELENYYNTLFKTMHISKIPQLREFIESEKPPSQKPPKAQKQEAAQPPSQVSAPKNDTIFNDIYEKTIEKFIDLNSEYITPPDDASIKKKKLEFQKVKVEGKSTIIQGMKLPKSQQENYIDFWATCYFQEKKQEQQQVLKQIFTFDTGFKELRQSVSTVITSSLLQ